MGQKSPQSPQVAPASSAAPIYPDGTQIVLAAVRAKAPSTHIKIPSCSFNLEVHLIMSDPEGHPSGQGPHWALNARASSTRSVGTHTSNRVPTTMGSSLGRGIQQTAPNEMSSVSQVEIPEQALQTGSSPSWSARLLPRCKNLPPSVSFLQTTGAVLGIDAWGLFQYFAQTTKRTQKNMGVCNIVM